MEERLLKRGRTTRVNINPEMSGHYHAGGTKKLVPCTSACRSVCSPNHMHITGCHLSSQHVQSPIGSWSGHEPEATSIRKEGFSWQRHPASVTQSETKLTVKGSIA